jgi:hypothetical protein
MYDIAGTRSGGGNPEWLAAQNRRLGMPPQSSKS